MKIRLLSDIHQEFYEDTSLYKSQGEDVLVLAGDINVGSTRVLAALRKFYEHQKNIVYVPGNHEYYGGYVDAFDSNVSRLLATMPGVHFLNPGYAKIGDITFIGGCFWTNFREDYVSMLAAKSMISDFAKIAEFSPYEAAALHSKHFRYLYDAFRILPGKKVVVTHFLPAVECVDARWKDAGAINDYFANDYGSYISELGPDVPYWLFGHTHSNVDIAIGGTRCISNPYGYNENKQYVERIIEL